MRVVACFRHISRRQPASENGAHQILMPNIIAHSGRSNDIFVGIDMPTYMEINMCALLFCVKVDLCWAACCAHTHEHTYIYTILYILAAASRRHYRKLPFVFLLVDVRTFLLTTTTAAVLLQSFDPLYRIAFYARDLLNYINKNGNAITRLRHQRVGELLLPHV